MAQVNTAQVTITPLRISTMTVTGHIGTKIDIPKLWAAVPIMPYWNLAEGILKMEHNMNKKGMCRHDIMLKRKKQKKKFYNQASRCYYLPAHQQKESYKYTHQYTTLI